MSTQSDVLSMAKNRFVSLRTRKRDGSTVANPMNVGEADGRVFFRTWKESGKAKRLRNFPDITLAPCNFKGVVSGDEVAFRVREVTKADDTLAARAMRNSSPIIHGFIAPLAYRLQGHTLVHYEVLPTKE